MNTPWISPDAASAPTSSSPIQPALRRPNGASGWMAIHRHHRAPIVVLLLLTVTGCGYTQGKLLFLFGVGRGAKVEAQFRLTPNPVLVLVDDPGGRLDWPPAWNFLTDDVSEELIRRKAAQKIIPRQTIEQIRQREPDFGKRGCREIGEMAGAEQVLWIEVKDFLADPLITEASSAAYLAVTVRVINVLENESRSRVRLWPVSPEGKFEMVALSGARVMEAKTRDGISRALTTKLAEEIAKYFYDHRLGDFEKPK